ncbi:MAG: TIGR00730 family Rossman fold protein [Caulobacteraceae bacterium]
MRFTVFLGSKIGAHDRYREATAELGRAMVKAGVGLVYGGASIGLMGVLANTVLSGGGEVIGVIPEALVRREIMRDDLTELHIVASMHERKALMAERGDAFVALPGGLGTFEELFEVWTWAQLGFHDKPCALLNVDGFFDGLLDFVAQARRKGFLLPEDRRLLAVETEPGLLVDQLCAEIAARAPSQTGVATDLI